MLPSTFDGKKAGSVSNGGKGTPNAYQPWTIEKLLAEIVATLPPRDMTKFGLKEPLPQNADSIIDELVQAELERKDIVKIMSTKLYFRIPGTEYKKGEWQVAKAKTTPERIKLVVAKYGPDTVILGHNCHTLS